MYICISASGSPTILAELLYLAFSAQKVFSARPFNNSFQTNSKLHWAEKKLMLKWQKGEAVGLGVGLMTLLALALCSCCNVNCLQLCNGTTLYAFLPCLAHMHIQYITYICNVHTYFYALYLQFSASYRPLSIMTNGIWSSFVGCGLCKAAEGQLLCG